jgi:hypothetical protein
VETLLLFTRGKEINSKTKKECTDGLKSIMKEREIESVNVNNVGQILYTKNEVKKSINKKYLNDILNQYYSTTPQAAKEICDYILENRETQIKEKCYKFNAKLEIPLPKIIACLENSFVEKKENCKFTLIQNENEHELLSIKLNTKIVG